jgi:D-threo-aldose 1-dehydrogenase
VSLTTHERKKDALRLLQQAFDSGISHYDVARLYGMGLAESVLGEFLRVVPREQVTVATKFGLEPPAALAHRASLIRLGKQVLRVIPGLRSVARRAAASRQLQAGASETRYSAQAAARSLEVSLRELACDYVDLFLLHEAQLAEASAPELLDFLDRQVRAGRIRAYGVASHTSRLGCNLAHFPPGHAVFQFNNAALDAEITGIEGTENKMLITHSALAPIKLARQAMRGRESLVREWSARIDANLADDSVLAELFLDYALQSNEKGVVLFGTMRSEHLRGNVQRVSGRGRPPEQVALFVQFCGILTRQVTA